jgi:hypothetical protein
VHARTQAGAIQQIMAEPLCDVTLTNPFATGTYAMLNVTLSPCLQRCVSLFIFYCSLKSTGPLLEKAIAVEVNRSFA